MGYRIKCNSCGHEFDVDKWTPDTECPGCGRKDTVPVTQVGVGRSAKGEEGTDWRHNPVVGAVAAVVLVLSLGALLWWKFKPAPRYEVHIYAICEKCNKTFDAVEGQLPSKCPFCGSVGSVYEAYKCQKCGAVFPFKPPKEPEPLDEMKLSKMSPEERKKAEEEYSKAMDEYNKKMAEAIKCPKCGSSDTRLYYTPEQEKKFEEIKKKLWKPAKKKKK